MLVLSSQVPYTLNIISESQVVEAIKGERSILKDSALKCVNGPGSDKVPSEETSVHQQGADESHVLDEQQNRDMDNEISKDRSSEEAKVIVDLVQNDQASRRDKRKTQNQSRWRGVDPVIFFKDEATIRSIVSYYGIKDSLTLDGHLVTRNPDTSHVKRIYYVSKSVQEVLELNVKVGERLKITSLGLKIFVSVTQICDVYLFKGNLTFNTNSFIRPLSFRKGSQQRRIHHAHLGCHLRDCHCCFLSSPNRFCMHQQ
jgi:multisite-specific tRNA:(cytosine-C5)-methyltransferase